MSKYTVIITKSAEKELTRLPVEAVVRIRDKVRSLADEPRPEGCKKLRGHKDLYRIRTGNYRIIYSIQDSILTVTIIAIGDRKDIYG